MYVVVWCEPDGSKAGWQVANGPTAAAQLAIDVKDRNPRVFRLDGELRAELTPLLVPVKR